MPLYVAGLPIFSKAYYATRPFDESTLDIPLGSGPYKVGKFEVNRYIEFERVKDWWAADLPVARGSYNFDIVRYEFYRDRDVAFEGFPAKSYMFREEFTARIWATRYDFPAVKDGRVKLETLPDETPSGAQGWFINTRRDKFKDARVREALIDAFDFEWTNKTIMYGAYARTHSPFQNSDMMVNGGPPSPEELKLLEPFRGQVPWTFNVIEGVERIAAYGIRAMAYARQHSRDDWVERPGFKIFWDAPVVIIISGPVGDCSRAGQNLMLSAHARGLGTCWVGSPTAACLRSATRSATRRSERCTA